MFNCLSNVIETKKHQKKITKMESGHTFLRYFFLTLPLELFSNPFLESYNNKMY